MKTKIYSWLFALLLVGLTLFVSCTEDIVSDRRGQANHKVEISAAPATGGVGNYISFTGYNLDRVTAVFVGGDRISASQFYAQSSTEVVFVLPNNGAYTAASNSTLLKVIYLDTTEAEQELIVKEGFSVIIPTQPTSPSQGAGVSAVLGDMIEFTDGQNLNLYDSVFIGTVKGIITDKSATSMSVMIPLNYPNMGVISVDIVGYYGGALRLSKVFKTGFKLNTTPVGPTEPSMTSITADEGYYLAKKVVISGEGLDLVTKVTVGDLTAVINKDASTAASLVFSVPEDYTFNVAKDCSVVLFYGTDSKKSVASVKVYPFYYWKDITIASSASVATEYPDAHSQIAFFSMETGEVLSGKSFRDQQWDPFYLAGTNAAAAPGGAKNSIDKSKITEEQYKAIKPYIFGYTSGTKVSIYGPMNSATAMQAAKYDSGGGIYAKMPNTWGTPIVGFGTLGYTGSAASNFAYADSLRNGTITSLHGYTATTGSGAPALATSTAANNTFTLSTDPQSANIMAISWISYRKGVLSGAVNSDYYKQGFIVVKSVTDIDSNNQSVVVDGKRPTTITFDCYWPKNFKNQ